MRLLLEIGYTKILLPATWTLQSLGELMENAMVVEEVNKYSRPGKFKPNAKETEISFRLLPDDCLIDEIREKSYEEEVCGLNTQIESLTAQIESMKQQLQDSNTSELVGACN
jgi:hypothetical protein